MRSEDVSELIIALTIISLFVIPVVVVIYVGLSIDRKQDQRMEKCVEATKDYKACYEMIVK